MPADVASHRQQEPTFVRRLAGALIDIVFPPHCGLCREPLVQGDDSLCQACGLKINEEIAERACPRCAQTVGPHGFQDGGCGGCRDRTLRITGVVRVGPYEPTLAGLVRAHKYGGREEAGRLLGGWLADVVEGATWFDQVQAVVPVPTHWRHRIRRPLHAADELAERVARRVGIPLTPILRRTRGGKHQVGLTYSERLTNVRGAFAVRRGARFDGATLLLIDDARTTGATLEECAKMLLAGGAEKIYAAVVVRAKRPHPRGEPARL